MVQTERKYAHIKTEYTPNPHTCLSSLLTLVICLPSTPLVTPYPEKPCNISPTEVMERSQRLLGLISINVFIMLVLSNLLFSLDTERTKPREKQSSKYLPRTSNSVYGWVSEPLVCVPVLLFPFFIFLFLFT